MHRGLDIGEGGDTGGDDHGFALAGGILDEGDISDFKRGYFVERNLQCLEEVDGGRIKRRGKKDQPLFFRFSLNG